MAFIIPFILIVLAVSFDGFTVGITYGLRKISITIVTLFIIVFCSGSVVLFAMIFGKAISRYLQPEFTSYIGGTIFICLGLFLLFSLIKTNRKNNMNKSNTYGSIMQNPTIVDKDQSGSISPKEAIVLGFALALDGFGAGFGAAMLGYPMIVTTGFIALSSGLFVFSGFKLGAIFANIQWVRELTYLPPILLIIIGTSSLF